MLNQEMTKPRVRVHTLNWGRVWTCSDNNFLGRGSSPQQAYALYQKNKSDYQEAESRRLSLLVDIAERVRTILHGKSYV